MQDQRCQRPLRTVRHPARACKELARDGVAVAALPRWQAF